MTIITLLLAFPISLVKDLNLDSGGEVVSQDLACCFWKSSIFIGGLVRSGGRMLFFLAWSAKPDIIIEIVFVVCDSLIELQ
jgi:hypothetical protein